MISSEKNIDTITNTWIKIDQIYLPICLDLLCQIQIFNNLLTDINATEIYENKPIIFSVDTALCPFITIEVFNILINFMITKFNRY